MTRTLLTMAGVFSGIVVMVSGQATPTGQATGPAQVTYIGHDKVSAGGTILTASNLKIQMNRRTGTGESEIHDKETDTLYILSGSATFVVGGEMIAPRVTEPGQHRGTGVTGGTSYALTKGDVMVIPAGQPHWFKEVKEPIDYYVVKAIAP